MQGITRENFLYWESGPSSKLQAGLVPEARGGKKKALSKKRVVKG